MKKQFFYFIGTAFLLCYSSTFTSCVNGVDDEYLELVTPGNGGSDNDGEDDNLPDLNGDYVNDGELDLVMTYNGEELTGKKVNVAADEQNETAVITLSGCEQDLSPLLGGLLPFSFTSNSPIPGQKEVTLSDVKLFKHGTTYRFEGELPTPAYMLNYKGTIENNKMYIDIRHELVNQTLTGTWKLKEKNVSGGAADYAPLWFECDSEVKANLGKLGFIGLNLPIYSIVSMLTGGMSSMFMKEIIGENIQTEDAILNMLQSVSTEQNGCMFATYNYSGDIMAPQWSSEMPHNVLRYYHGGKEGQIFLEVNADFLIEAIGGLMKTAAAANGGVTRSDPEAAKEKGRQLIELLTPVLRDGIPCEYVFEEDGTLKINIDGTLLRTVLLKLLDLANDDYVRPLVDEFLDTNVAGFASNLKSFLDTAPAALTYHDYNNETKEYSGECGPTKLGFRLQKQ